MKIGGTKVVDATSSIVITITPQDVERGARRAPGGCAAALACKRQFKAKDVRIHIGRSYLRMNGTWVRYITSSALRSELIAFDRGGRFMPGEYRLNRVSPGNRLGARPKEPRGPHKTRRRRIALIHHVVEGVRERGANK